MLNVPYSLRAGTLADAKTEAEAIIQKIADTACRWVRCNMPKCLLVCDSGQYGVKPDLVGIFRNEKEAKDAMKLDMEETAKCLGGMEEQNVQRNDHSVSRGEEIYEWQIIHLI